MILELKHFLNNHSSNQFNIDSCMVVNENIPEIRTCHPLNLWMRRLETGRSSLGRFSKSGEISQSCILVEQ